VEKLVPRSKHILIGSLEAYSGKSTVTLGLAHCLQQQGVDIAYGKPLGTCSSSDPRPEQDFLDADVGFIAEALQLSKERLRPTLLLLNDITIGKRLQNQDLANYAQLLTQAMGSNSAELVLLEGPGSLDEGRLYGLSLKEMAEGIDAAVVLVTRFGSALTVERLLVAKERMGDRLTGVILNDVAPEQQANVKSIIQPFLEQAGIPVLGTLPHSEILKSVSVRELVQRLKAEILCSHDRLDLMVETLYIGAMNVNSALKYFRQGHNMAIVTGGDRTDLQLAALETSTQCLILTGHIAPSLAIINRAEEMEIPILSVDLDTLSTVEIIENAFGHVRLHEGIKKNCAFEMGQAHLDIHRLFSMVGVATKV
jgi:BioD-like phosphotransacetylase family protein